MWNNISNYLDKFFKITPPGKPGDFYRHEISKIIKDSMNMEINDDDIDYQWGIVYVKTKNSAIKNEIFINKTKILKIINEKFKKKQIEDIRFT